MPEKTSIKNWDDDDKPREKLLALGKTALSDAELLAILMGSGSREKSAVELGREILTSCDNDLNRLMEYSVTDLMKFRGVGEAKAISVIAALELGIRRETAIVRKKPKIKSSADAYNYIRASLENLPYEEFWIIMMNRANQILGKKRISSGSVTSSIADPKIIFKIAIDNRATGIIIIHNHPSGNIKPSESDINITKKIKKAGEIMDINVTDHLIIGEKEYFSFHDEGLI